MEKNVLPCDTDNASKQSNKAESEPEQTILSKKRKKEDKLTLSCLSPSIKKPKVPYVPQILTQKEEKYIDDVITDVLKKYSNKSDQAETEIRHTSMMKESKLNISSNSDKLDSSETNLVSPKRKKAKKESKLTPVKPVITENTDSSNATAVNISGDLNLSLKDDDGNGKLEVANGSPKKKLKKRSKKKASSSPSKTSSLVESYCIPEQTEEQSSIKSKKKAKKTKSKVELNEVATKVGGLASEKLNGSDYEFDIDKELIPKATKSKNKELKNQNNDSDKKQSENQEKTASEEYVAKKEKKKKKKKKAKQNKE